MNHRPSQGVSDKNVYFVGLCVTSSTELTLFFCQVCSPDHHGPSGLSHCRFAAFDPEVNGSRPVVTPCSSFVSFSNLEKSFTTLFKLRESLMTFFYSKNNNNKNRNLNIAFPRFLSLPR